MVCIGTVIDVQAHLPLKTRLLRAAYDPRIAASVQSGLREPPLHCDKDGSPIVEQEVGEFQSSTRKGAVQNALCHPGSLPDQTKDTSVPSSRLKKLLGRWIGVFLKK